MKRIVVSGLLAAFVFLKHTVAAVYPESIGSAAVIHLPIFKNRDVEAAQIQKRSSGLISVSLNNEETLYFANASVGTPPQNFGLQIDTGSSDTWVPWTGSSLCHQASSKCIEGVFDPSKSSTYKNVLSGGFNISYVDGSTTSGDYFTDTFTIGGFSIQNLQMGLGKQSTIRAGLLGISYTLSESSVDKNGKGSYPTVVDAMVSGGLISSQAYSLWLDDLEASTGNVLFGGIDTDKYEGSLSSIPIYPDMRGFYTRMTVALTSVGVTGSKGHDSLTPEGFAIPAILDSGSTLTVLPDDLADLVFKEIPAVQDENYGVLVPCTLAQASGTFDYQFEGSNGPLIHVPISELVLPLQDDAGNPATFRNGEDACVFGIQSAAGRPTILGDTFLRSAYVVYDLANNRIGIAPTNFNSTSGSGGSKIIAFSSAGASIPDATSVISGPQVTDTASGIVQIGGATGAGSATAQPSNPTVVPTGFGFGGSSASTSMSSATGGTTASATSTAHKNAARNVEISGPVATAMAVAVGGVFAFI